ncbi:MAG: transketolase [Nocardioidaceae bacterium]|jgi:transketolase|nr:transketolase [Nocardioidaceae bacterium]
MTTQTTNVTAGTASGPLRYEDLPGLIALQTGDEKHDGAAASTLDVLWVLYDEVLHVSPQMMDDPARDRFYLSKGHGPSAYYAVLAANEFFPVDWLPTFGAFDSPLGYHPDRNLVPGMEISSGSLGHGLPLAVGTVLGLRAQGLTCRVVTLVGDAELDEGTNAEAIEFAGAAGLAALTVVAVDNDSATWGWRGGLETRFAVAGWDVSRVDGRDHASLAAALRRTHATMPTLVVAQVEANS